MREMKEMKTFTVVFTLNELEAMKDALKADLGEIQSNLWAQEDKEELSILSSETFDNLN